MHGHRVRRLELDDLRLELHALADFLEDVPEAAADLRRALGEGLASVRAPIHSQRRSEAASQGKTSAGAAAISIEASFRCTLGR